MTKFSNDLIEEFESVQDEAEHLARLIGKVAKCEDRAEGIEKLRAACDYAKNLHWVLEELMDSAEEECGEDEE